MMKKIYTLLALCALMASCQSETSTDAKEPKINTETDSVSVLKDTLVLEEPEAEVADFTKIEHYAALDTKAKLVENFGKENIKDGSTWYGEGSTELKHSVLTNPSNGHIVKYVWKEENPTQLSFIEIFGILRNKDYEAIGTQKIGSECGIFTGMTLKEMRDWNGEDFEFSGFGWDFGGMVRYTEESNFAKCNLSLRLEIKFEEGKNQYDALYGDTDLFADATIKLGAPITLDQLTLFVD